jgi:two-component system cell cycle response regulator
VEDGRKIVLVIDDQDDERAIQRAMLSHIGYEVREASNGEAGLHTAVETPPDLILLDVAMPRMDGFSVCRALRANPHTADVPILLFTASVVGNLEEQADQAGATGVLTKPVDPRKVAAEVRRLIGSPAE